MNTAELVAGRELDALVAEKVMGLRPCAFTVTGSVSGIMNFYQCEHPSSEHCYPKDRGELLSKYSTDIGAAWQVVEHLADMGVVLHVKVDGERPKTRRYTIIGVEGRIGPDCESAPLAICRAALVAV